jgi:tetratricopeptide (TPR) repeat protein
MAASFGRILIAFALGTCILAEQMSVAGREHLNRGIAFFKQTKYEQAVAEFTAAVHLDPESATAHLYLATAEMSQYIPGADAPENRERFRAASDGFVKVLERDPQNEVAMMSLASLHYNDAQGTRDPKEKLEKLAEASRWYAKLVEAKPENKEAWYSLGVIAWARWYPALMQARKELDMKPEDPGPLRDASVRTRLRTEWDSQLAEGMKALERALEIDPEYDDAMAYMNLLVRQRADLLDTPEEWASAVAVADEWVQKALETKKKKAE